MKHTLSLAAVLSIVISALTVSCGHDGSTTETHETTVAPSALSLKDAFDRISTLPGFTRKTSMDSLWIDTPCALKGVRVAAALSLDREQTRQTGDAIYSILDTLPLTSLVNGASNLLVMGFVYANPIASGEYEVLIVAGSGYDGTVAAVYGTTDSSTVSIIRNAPLVMKGAGLTMEMPSAGVVGKDYLINFGGD